MTIKDFLEKAIPGMELCLGNVKVNLSMMSVENAEAWQRIEFGYITNKKYADVLREEYTEMESEIALLYGLKENFSVKRSPDGSPMFLNEENRKIYKEKLNLFYSSLVSEVNISYFNEKDLSILPHASTLEFKYKMKYLLHHEK